jgi:type IV pilus assembly protein PilX
VNRGRPIADHRRDASGNRRALPIVRRSALPSRRGSRGVVLVVALILVAVIGISSAMAMRLSLFGDIVSKNMRAQNLALQSAELALRFCERQVALDPGAVPMVSGLGSDLEWQLPAQWQSALTVPEAALGTVAGYRTAPQCLVRLFSVDEFLAAWPPDPGTVSSDARGYSSDYVVLHRITARGFSPDFERDANGQPVAGAEVWLQSLVRGVQ